MIAMIPRPAEDKPLGKGGAMFRKILYILAANLAFSGVISIASPMIAAKSGLVARELADSVILGVALMIGGALLFAVARRQK